MGWQVALAKMTKWSEIWHPNNKMAHQRFFNKRHLSQSGQSQDSNSLKIEFRAKKEKTLSLKILY
jgi:hypothetical protein